MTIEIVAISLILFFILLYLVLKLAKKRKNSSSMTTEVNLHLGDRQDAHVDKRRAKLDDIDPSVKGVRLTSAQKKRRSAGIAAYVGRNGSGKSATMILDTLPDLAAGRNVLSTVALLAPYPAESVEEADTAWAKMSLSLRPDNPLSLPHPLWIPFTDFRQLLEFRNGVVLMDEVQGVADSRDSQGLPVQVRNVLYQLRRNGVILRWSTIDWSAADIRIRQVTQVVTLCRGLLPRWEPGVVWAKKRMFWLRTYDATEFLDFTQAINRSSTKQRPKSICRQMTTAKGRIRSAFAAYDSMAQVLVLGAASEGGMCLGCGGKRQIPRCTCSDAAPAEGTKRAARTQPRRAKPEECVVQHAEPPEVASAATAPERGRHAA